MLILIQEFTNSMTSLLTIVRKLGFALSVGLVFSLPLTSFALPSDANQPIKLNANTAEFNQKSGIITYAGSVKLVQGTLNIKADRVVIALSGDGSIQKVTASGSPVTVSQQLKAGEGLSTGRANQLVYRADQGVVELIGNAKLTQQGASITGETISYGLDQGDFKAAKGKSSEQVELILPPSSSRRTSGILPGVSR